MAKRRKRKLRAEAVTALVLISLLSLVVIMMTLSFFGKDNLLDVIIPVSTESKGVIVIDPGHGGHDPGAEAGGLEEAGITLNVGKKMGEYLTDAGYEVIYTRNEDVALGEYELADLINRVNIGEENEAKLFVSLHMNLAPDIEERCYGFEIYNNESSEMSVNLANNINSELLALDYSASRGVHSGEALQVVAINQVPAVLVELGFLDDLGDFEYITSTQGNDAIAKALAEAVKKTIP